MNKVLPSKAAQQWLETGSLVLDTETTGLDMNAEIVEIAIITSCGKPIIDTLIKPLKPIPAEATAIHGITNEMVEFAPTWPEIHEQVISLFKAGRMVIYNSDYDVRLIRQTAMQYKLWSCYDDTVILDRNARCAMLAYAEFWGDWNEYREQYKWQKLTNAAAQQGVEVKGAHRALADCLMTLEVVKAMASAEVSA